jgi:hypothetical protein
MLHQSRACSRMRTVQLYEKMVDEIAGNVLDT